jgi:hypothetical protein
MFHFCALFCDWVCSLSGWQTMYNVLASQKENASDADCIVDVLFDQ